MDPIVTLALVGTARQERVNPATGTPVDTLTEDLSSGEAEQKLLLSAGAWAVYRQAGRMAQQMEVEPEPAPPERLRACSSSAALVLSRFLDGEHVNLLPEVLARLREVGMHLPYNLLPAALNKREKEARAALFPVLGERGVWLSRFNPAWNWVRDFLPTDESGVPAEAETLWQEGTPAQRAEILRRLRAVDPARAREWLADTWKKERAEVRADLLAACEIGLSAEDEEFLENALDDRAQSVRTIATNLLPRLPDSAFARRMITRGTALLQIGQGGKLKLALPDAIEKDWRRDGIIENPPNKLGKRAWWLIQVLGSIPPTFWETQFALSPDRLIELANEDKWGLNIIDGWSKAAVSHNAISWTRPLWEWWLEHYDKLKEEKITDYTIREKLFKCMARDEAESLLLDLLRKSESQGEESWTSFLSELPQPWSDTFGFTILHTLQARCLQLPADIKQFNPYYNPWFNSLGTVALALPVACLEEASQPWAFPEEGSEWQLNYARQMLKNFVETIQMRQKIYEEII